MNGNTLFITNDVRQYILYLYNKDTITKALSITLYLDLCKFIEKIKIFETTGKKDNLKNFLANKRAYKS